jgi:hypothetical protein
MASFLSYPMGQVSELSPASDGLGPVPDFSLDITTESFLEVDNGGKKPDSEDSPIQMVPQPSFPKVSPAQLTPDPDLCLTPDKPERPPVVQVEKNKHVRFEVPTLESGTSVNTQSTVTAAVENTDDNKENITADLNPDMDSKVYRYVQKQKEIPEPVDDNENIIKKDKDSVHIFAKLKTTNFDPNMNSNKSTLPRVMQTDFDEPPAPRKRPPPESAKVYFPRPLPKVTQPGVVTAEEHIFQRPEFHSTLNVNQEMKQLKTASLDVVKAVEEKLDGSPNARNQFKEKVSCLEIMPQQ